MCCKFSGWYFLPLTTHNLFSDIVTYVLVYLFCPIFFTLKWAIGFFFSIRILILLLKRSLYSIIPADRFRPFCMRNFSLFSFFLNHTKCLFLFHFAPFVIYRAFNYIPRVCFERCWFALKKKKKKFRPLESLASFCLNVYLVIHGTHLLFWALYTGLGWKYQLLLLKLQIVNVI